MEINEAESEHDPEAGATQHRLAEPRTNVISFGDNPIPIRIALSGKEIPGGKEGSNWQAENHETFREEFPVGGRFQLRKRATVLGRQIKDRKPRQNDEIE